MFKKFLENLMGIILAIFFFALAVGVVGVAIGGGVILFLILIGGFHAVAWGFGTIAILILFLPAIALLMTITGDD